MTKRKRVIALLLAAAFVLVTAFSFAVIAVEANHTCTDDDCPVCGLIAFCENNIKTISAAVFLIAFNIALVIKRVRAELICFRGSIKYNLITLLGKNKYCRLINAELEG